MRVSSLGMSLCLLGCGPGPEKPPPPGGTNPIAADFAALASDSGSQVTNGHFSFSSMDNCCAPGAQCLGNNVLTPYATWALPPSPGQEVEDIDYYWSFGSEVPQGMSRDYHLRPDEALVWIGTLPGESAYMGMRTYLSSRLNPDGWRELVMGSLGRPTNAQTIAEDRGVSTAEIWGTEAAIVSTADGAAARRIREWLVVAGLPESHIHIDHISHSDVSMGVAPEDDTFLTFMRVALPADAESHEAYKSNPPVSLFRVTPEEAAPATEPYPRDALPPKGSGETEVSLVESANALEAAIGDAWPYIHRDIWASLPVEDETYTCLPTGNCSGELWDRYLARVAGPTLSHDGEFIVVYGVNHEATGKASYASVAIQTIETQTGIAAVHSRQMPGSAQAFLGADHPDADHLFAWVFARDCDLFEGYSCTTVPKTCPGIPSEDPVKLVYRAYLEPSTGAAPTPGEIILGRAMVFDSTRVNEDLIETSTSSPGSTTGSTTSSP